jgi:hypothetical protein
MANKLLKAVSPIFFWSSMTAVVAISLLLISTNYKVVVIDSVIAAEMVYEPTARTLIKDNSTSRTFIDCDCDKRFNKEYPIVWSGRVISTFVSGEDFGVKRFDQNTEYKQFYVIGHHKYNGEPGANVKVIGRLIGLTCAYANTVFGGCVGEVEADQVVELNN